jgi:hypothetical protein
MPEEKPEELRRVEHRYLKQLEVSVFMVILCCLWVGFVIISTYYLGMGYRWSLLSLEEWIYVGCFVIGFFLVIELVVYAHYRSLTKGERKREKPTLVFFQGKRVHVFTYPVHAKGGIFSKTYIPLGNDTLVQVRTQMVPPRELWSKKEP